MSKQIQYRLFAMVVLLFLACGSARAACTIQPFFLPVHLRVGADTQSCQYNDIQSAINAVGECPTIVDVTREHLYTNQHLSIDNKPNLTLQGWGDGVTCSLIHGPLDFPPYAPPDDITPLVNLDGGGGGGRVLTITGNSNVTLRNLTVLRGATDPSATGGGIDFNGSGSLTLTRSTISFNNAGYGAGINMYGSGGAASLTLASDTLVILNTASTSGGGIRLTGNTRMYALQPKTLIGYNHAPNGYGGGMEVIGPARADIGSPGYNGLAVIYDNDAQYGGGMDILIFDDDADAIVRLFTTDAHNPVQVSGNFASHTGGAVYLKAHRSFLHLAASVLCAYDFRIEDNAAQEGTAIYSDADYNEIGDGYGGSIALNTNPTFDSTDNFCVQTEAPPALGAVACAAGTVCNQIAGNKAEDESSQPTAGATILLQTHSELHADRVKVLANTGGHLVREIGDTGDIQTEAYMSNCLLADNVLTQELLVQTDGTGAFLVVDSCTIAGNQIGAPYAFLVPGLLNLTNSIVDQPGRATVDPAQTDPARIAHVLSNDRSTLPDSAYIDEGEPTFVDAANGDYHLRLASLGIDAAPVETYPGAPKADLDRRPRVYDQPAVANNFGPMDLGAYELQPSCAHADTVYCDGFEIQ